MKIEKLTDDKIRIILKKDDLKNRDIDIKSIISSSPESQSLFLEILNKAEKEIDFYTDGHKLLIETYFQDNDIIVCIITKYIEKKHKKYKMNHKYKKYISINNTNASINPLYYIYKFKDFENFCEYCNFLKNRNDLKIFFKSSILYFYKEHFYLVIDKEKILNTNFNISNIFTIFHSITTEFLTYVSLTKNFEIKLKEYGKTIINNNAINTGIRYFTYK